MCVHGRFSNIQSHIIYAQCAQYSNMIITIQQESLAEGMFGEFTLFKRLTEKSLANE